MIAQRLSVFASLWILLAAIPFASLWADQNENKTIEIPWQPAERIQLRNGEYASFLWFHNAVTKTESAMLPWFELPLALPAGMIAENPTLSNIICEIYFDTSYPIADEDFIPDDFKTSIVQRQSGDSIINFLQVFPLRKTEHGIEKLMQADFHYNTRTVGKTSSVKPPQYAETSVLSNGFWVKIPVTETGIYRINAQNLLEMGFDLQTLNPNNLAIYGNGGGMLPETNSSFRYDDLFENAILIEGENDETFDENDFIYFYGQAPYEWKYTSYNNRFSHQVNYYSDTTYYFLTLKTEPGKRIQQEVHTIVAPTAITNMFLDRQFHEQDLINLIHSGKEWYGEELTKANPQLTIDFNFPNRITDRPVLINMQFAARSITENLMFSFNANGQTLFDNVTLLILGVSNATYARESQHQLSFVDENETISTQLNLVAQGENSKAWLNYIRVNAWRELKYTDRALQFRNPEVTGNGQSVIYQIGNATEDMQLWDVSHPLVPENMSISVADEQLVFQTHAETLREFILFKPEHSLPIASFQHVANQNLHGIAACDMLIISHPDFMEEAETLAQLHFEDDGLISLVVNINDVYNEFGSGKNDVTAIRDFARMVYSKSENRLKYLLLFGDASFDYRNKTASNTNYVPTYQASNSTVETLSFVSDDYFGLFDTTEGLNMDGIVDIGIGRLPVRTKDEAIAMVEKIRHYLHNDPASMGEWRNNITFMADDADDNLHFRQAETLAGNIDTAYQNLNVSKVYLDAYRRVSVAGGYRYPDASSRLMQQLEEGTLILNYTGHGGVNGLTNEQVFTINHINSLTNWENLPFFITATCEFSRFDNPTLHSAGEQLLLNPIGGAIALMTTTRLAFAHSNFGINQRVYAALFAPGKQQIRRLGDIIRLSKNPTSSYVYNFVLLGDPALRLKYPEHSVDVISFNNLPPQTTDTIGAMAEITVQGQITNAEGLKVESFNGYVIAKLFDKKTKYRTLGNDQTSYPANFNYFDKLLYRGKASVTNGTFTIQLKLPRNIAYQFGKARFSFYAVDTLARQDAGGYYDNFVIGGLDETVDANQVGPDITAFIDSPDFKDGDKIGKDATLFIQLNDPQGINFLGNDIGRDILLVHEAPDNSQQHIINHLYQPEMNDFSSGSIEFALTNLAEGMHTLVIKAWDLHNNSGTLSIHFSVDPDSKMFISNLRNAPNPFSSETNILFEHNKPGEKLFVEIDVYNMMGRRIGAISKEIHPTGLTAEPILLNFDKAGFSKPAAGIYLYRMKVSDAYNNHVTMFQKMIFLPDD